SRSGGRPTPTRASPCGAVRRPGATMLTTHSLRFGEVRLSPPALRPPVLSVRLSTATTDRNISGLLSSRVAARFHHLPNLKPEDRACDYLGKYHRSFSLH